MKTQAALEQTLPLGLLQSTMFFRNIVNYCPIDMSYNTFSNTAVRTENFALEKVMQNPRKTLALKPTDTQLTKVKFHSAAVARFIVRL
jgi:hypothetical protein